MEKGTFMKKKPKIIVITGAESTGKSTLTEQLALEFNAVCIPEIAREYVQNLKRRYTYFDVEKIAKQQILQLNKELEKQTPLIFLDTWLIITKVWFEVVFKKEPDWLNKAIHDVYIDLYLLCDTDIPWIPDPVRENGGENRNKLQKKYIEHLTNYNCNFATISGTELERFISAKTKVQQLLTEPSQ